MKTSCIKCFPAYVHISLLLTPTFIWWWTHMRGILCSLETINSSIYNWNVENIEGIGWAKGEETNQSIQRQHKEGTVSNNPKAINVHSGKTQQEPLTMTFIPQPQTTNCWPYRTYKFLLLLYLNTCTVPDTALGTADGKVSALIELTRHN